MVDISLCYRRVTDPIQGRVWFSCWLEPPLFYREFRSHRPISYGRDWLSTSASEAHDTKCIQNAADRFDESSSEFMDDVICLFRRYICGEFIFSSRLHSCGGRRRLDDGRAARLAQDNGTLSG